jgi:hypothetical protein
MRDPRHQDKLRNGSAIVCCRRPAAELVLGMERRHCLDEPGRDINRQGKNNRIEEEG